MHDVRPLEFVVETVRSKHRRTQLPSCPITTGEAHRTVVGGAGMSNRASKNQMFLPARRIPKIGRVAEGLDLADFAHAGVRGHVMLRIEPHEFLQGMPVVQAWDTV